ncbi:uncharacterized protein LOC135831586 [Planococcus citri]|uniref:uncharacterized protein LOC135831586 n=1 Tax=Planococcus citri TaxID=170843 RepID=UPI0031F7BE7F
MVYCAVPGCKSRYGKSTPYKFHVLPREENRRNEWIKFSQRTNFELSKRYYFCELHFDKNHYELNRKDELRKLKPNIVPTINPPSSEDVQRYKQMIDLSKKKKGNTRKHESTIEIIYDDPSTETISEIMTETISDASTVSPEINDFQNEIEKSRNENDQLRNMILKMQLVLERRKANEINYLNENQRLRKENQKLQTENTILKKALARFA